MEISYSSSGCFLTTDCPFNDSIKVGGIQCEECRAFGGKRYGKVECNFFEKAFSKQELESRWRRMANGW